MAERKQSKPRRKWTQQMNDDLLICKRRAVAMTTSGQPPLERIGKKKGYIKIMKELWDAKGYGELGFLTQNLRDQAARLEKSIGVNSQNTSRDERAELSFELFAARSNMSSDCQPVIDPNNFISQAINLSDTEEEYTSSHYGNSQVISSPDLHPICTNSEIPGGIEHTGWNGINTLMDSGGGNNTNQDNASENDTRHDNKSMPGCLPDYFPTAEPPLINWGKRNDGSTIVLSSSIIINAYNEIVRWKRNVFLVPYGKIGRDFIDLVTSHINDWNNSSDNCHVSLKAAFVLLAVGLQKPGPKSKAKDHQDTLGKRLILWREGEISKLLRECSIIQRRTGKLKGSASPDKTKVFAKLVLEGQINAALRFVSESSSGGVLPLTDDVMAQLKEKHPNPQPTKLGSLLFGPIVVEVPETLYSEINGEMVREQGLHQGSMPTVFVELWLASLLNNHLRDYVRE